jgi:hypothetical protein
MLDNTKPTIYIIKLEQYRYFIYESNSIYTNKILFECELYHDFPKQYKPISIVEKYEFKNISSVDSLVKDYMLMYGIEYVRGGSYSDTELSESQFELISKELDYIENGPKYDYSFEEVLKYQYRPYQSIAEIDEIASNIKSKYDKYIFEKERHATLFPKQFSVTINSIKIEDIDWLFESCTISDKDFREKINIEKYKQILRGIKHVYYLSKHTEFFERHESKIKEYDIYLKYPEFVFDQFLLDKYPRISLDKVYSFYLLLKTLIAIAKNRIEEYIFDICSYDRSIQWKTTRILYILEKKRREFNTDIVILDVD